MAILLADAATGTRSAGTTVSATLAGAPAAGRVLVAQVVGDTTAQTLVSNDGLAFELVRSQTGSGTSYAVYLRVCTGVETATFTFRRNDSASDNFSLNLTLWSGVNPANPYYALDIITVANSDTVVIPAQNAGIANTVVLALLAIPSTTTVLTPPAGYTLGSEIDGFNPGASAYYIAQAASGSTGTVTWVTAAIANSLKGLAIILRPDPGYSYVQGIVGSGVNTDNAGGNAWSNPGNITADDPNAASCTLSGITIQDSLDGGTLGFAVPAGATIKGYEVQVGSRFRSGGTTGAARDGTLQLLDAGVAVGSNRAVTTQWPIDPVTLLYGHPDDLWGATIAPTDHNLTGFGARLGVRGAAAGADRVANVDFLHVTVYYEAADEVTGELDASVTITAAFEGTVEVPAYTGALAAQVTITAAFAATRELPAGLEVAGSGGSGGEPERRGRHKRRRPAHSGAPREKGHRWADVAPLEARFAAELRFTASFRGTASKSGWQLDDDDLEELLLLDAL